MKKYGGRPSDYLPIHRWFDESKAHHADFRHRALRHHAEGIFLMESIFGVTLTLSTCWRCGNPLTAHSFGDTPPCVFEPKVIPTRWIGEQHVQEDLGFIPAATDWLKKIQMEPWMNRSRRLSVELKEDDVQKVEAEETVS